MKKIYLSLFLTLSFGYLFAQTVDLQHFNEIRLNKTKTAMTILGTWAVGNIAVGSVLASKKEGEDKAFHQMNALWNGVNLTLAGFGLYSAVTADPASFGLFETFNEQQKLQKILLFNAGLDVGYMAGGLYFREKGKNTLDLEKSVKYKGWGKSILLQGAFLFAFDLGTYFVLSSNNSEIKGLLEGLSFSGTGVDWKMVF
jgi:glucose uptake protein GlcU